jgi:hypothetical protein
LEVFVVFVEEKWFWGEMDSILYFYGAILCFNKYSPLSFF